MASGEKPGAKGTGAGLGTCVIGSAVGALNVADMKTNLGIPQDHAAIAPIS